MCGQAVFLRGALVPPARTTMAELLGVFLVGLLGSAHCVGMCGGFVVALAQMNDGARSLQVNHGLYFLGKTLTYAVLGALAGGFGAALGGLFATLQQGLSIALGVFLIVVGLGLVGVLRRFEGNRFWTRFTGLSRLMGTLLQRRGSHAVLALGMLNGLLPCGLVYGMLAIAAASGSSVQGALVMSIFGVATLPALYLTGVASFLMRPVWRSRLTLVSGLLVIGLGLLTIVRGTPSLNALLHPAHAESTTVVTPHSH